MKCSGEKGFPWSLMSDEPLAEFLAGMDAHSSGFANRDCMSMRKSGVEPQFPRSTENRGSAPYLRGNNTATKTAA